MSATGIMRALSADCVNPSERLVLVHIGAELDEDAQYTGLFPIQIHETFDRLTSDGKIKVVSCDRFGLVVTIPGVPVAYR